MVPAVEVLEEIAETNVTSLAGFAAHVVAIRVDIKPVGIERPSPSTIGGIDQTVVVDVHHVAEAVSQTGPAQVQRITRTGHGRDGIAIDGAAAVLNATQESARGELAGLVPIGACGRCIGRSSGIGGADVADIRPVQINPAALQRGRAVALETVKNAVYLRLANPAVAEVIWTTGNVFVGRGDRTCLNGTDVEHPPVEFGGRCF